MVGRPAAVPHKYTDTLNSYLVINTPQSLIKSKQLELMCLVEVILSFNSSIRSASFLHFNRWIEISLNDLNARLWRWHDSLPSELRWDRWGSRFDAIKQSIAALQ
jgi:hypothetical protein